MKVVEVAPEDLSLSSDLLRSGRSKGFEEHLRSSIEEVGLAEPLKVARNPAGNLIVIDGALRLNAIKAIRAADPTRFRRIRAYLFEYDRRYEIRYQSDIYQDLLPSQLATLVEHLHRSENVLKSEIARYIGVSPATLRNYTGLWRLLERGGLAARVVELMDVNVLPASNPFAWLRLTDAGVELALRQKFTNGIDPDRWISDRIDASRLGTNDRYPLKFVEAATADLPAEYFQSGADVREVKRTLGLRRATRRPASPKAAEARGHLERISRDSKQPVIARAAKSLGRFLA